MSHIKQQDETPYRENEESAAFLKISPRTLEKYRVSGKGPAFSKLGKRVVYHIDDLIEWAESHKRTSTSDEGAV
jgi:hypothetical protein